MILFHFYLSLKSILYCFWWNLVFRQTSAVCWGVCVCACGVWWCAFSYAFVVIHSALSQPFIFIQKPHLPRSLHTDGLDQVQAKATRRPTVMQPPVRSFVSSLVCATDQFKSTQEAPGQHKQPKHKACPQGRRRSLLATTQAQSHKTTTTRLLPLQP